jgi:hypothetical protein
VHSGPHLLHYQPPTGQKQHSRDKRLTYQTLCASPHSGHVPGRCGTPRLDHKAKLIARWSLCLTSTSPRLVRVSASWKTTCYLCAHPCQFPFRSRMQPGTAQPKHRSQPMNNLMRTQLHEYCHPVNAVIYLSFALPDIQLKGPSPDHQLTDKY